MRVADTHASTAQLVPSERTKAKHDHLIERVCVRRYAIENACNRLSVALIILIRRCLLSSTYCLQGRTQAHNDADVLFSLDSVACPRAGGYRAATLV